MKNSSFFCRVQALYPFESNEPSSLRFDKGDYIDVLTKLPSGWWHGWCNGSQGWFPSNYVKAMEDYGVTTITPTRRETAELFDDSVGVSDLNTKKRISLPPNWSIQIHKDGSASYYFNTLTGEMRSTYPYDDCDFYYTGESDVDSTYSTSCSSDSRTVSYGNTSENLLYFDSTLQQQGKWIQRTTPQGLPFFYNMSTQETSWHADPQEQPSQIQPRVVNIIQPTPSFDDNCEKITWTKLSLNITLTINNLIASTKNGQRSLYKQYAASVIDSIRFMLVSSGSISKDSTLIKTNSVLRSHHRTMMASMSKLVLSVQLCADGTVTDVSKLLTDCHELLVAVRNFISTCEAIPVEVQCVKPTIFTKDDPKLKRQDSFSTTPGSVIDQLEKYELQPDLIENLDAYGASMQESMESLMANLTRHSESRCSLAVLLFTQYRNFGDQNGQFLSIIEDIDFEGILQSPLMKDLAAAKQKLYDGLGLLFLKMQSMTDETLPLETVFKEMQEAGGVIIDAIKLVCRSVADLIAEKSQLLKEEVQAESNRNSGDVNRNSGDSNRNSGNSNPNSGDSNRNSGDSNRILPGFLRKSTKSHDFLLDMGLSPKLETTNAEESYGLSNLSQPNKYDMKPKASTSIELSRDSAPVEDPTSAITDTPKDRSDTLTDSQSKHTTAKITQFFGDDVPEPISPNNSSIVGAEKSPTPTAASHQTFDSQDEQRFLQYDYSPSEIVFTEEGNVKGGTLRALVERLTLHDYLDMNFNNTFFVTYRSFCTSLEVFELLKARYNSQPPDNLTPSDIEIWTNKKQKLIRLRVFNVIKIWLEQYYQEEDSVILDRLLCFTNTSIKGTLSFSAYQLERLIHKRKEACKDLKKLVISQPQDPPEPILPRNLKNFKLLGLDSLEMARQLTLMDFKLYSSIKSVECLDKAWSRDTSASSDHPVAANIQASINYCNQVTTWVSGEILSQSEVKKRSIIIKYWVSVADKCRSFNNFNTCMAILSAFDNSAVGRLKKTWEMVGARTNHVVAQIRQLMGANRNFVNYRGIIHSINPPCIPFLGIYLQDLTFIEDGNPNFLKTSKELINFSKRAKTAEVIREIQQYQTMGYQYKPVDEIQNFITENLHSARDEDQLYKESLKLEPKERDEEKIARLLQESGFL